MPRNKKQDAGPEEIPPDFGPAVAHEEHDSSSMKKKSDKGKLSLAPGGAADQTRTAPTSVPSDQTRNFPGAVQVAGPGGSSQQQQDMEDPAAEDEQLAVAAYVSEDSRGPGTSELSSSIVYGEPMSKRNKWLIAITILLVILIGSVIAVAVVLTQNNGGSDTNPVSAGRDIPTATPVEDGVPTEPSSGITPTGPTPTSPPQPTPSPIILPTNPPVPASDTFDFEQSLRLMIFTEAGGFLRADSSDAVATKTACAAFCVNYDALQFASNVIGDKCICFTMDDTVSQHCAHAWGQDQVDTSDVASGSILSKRPIAECATEYCQALPNEGLCFTGNQLNLREYTLASAGGYNQTDSTNVVSSEFDCRTYCKNYDAMRYSSNVVGDKCLCFTASADSCVTPWGDSVVSSSVASGSVLSKQPFTTCSEDFCTVSPNEGLCFTGNSLSLREYSLTQAGGYEVADSSNNVDSELDCRTFCAVYDAMRWASSVIGDKCICFSGGGCATPWGDQVNAGTYVAWGTIFSKEPFTACSDDFCTIQPDQGLCFTGTTLSLREFTLNVAGGFEVATSSDLVASEVDCRTFCREHDAMRWASSVVGDKCICFSAVEGAALCAMPWGNQVNAATHVAFGTLFSKQPLAACDVDFCTVEPDAALCFTANELGLKEYVLIDTGGYEVSAVGALASTETECRVFCATHDAMRWAGSTSGDKCVCYALIAGFEGEPCATPWGEQVNANTYVAFGSVFAKQPFAICSADLCTARPDDPICFTANTLSLRNYDLTEAGGYEVSAVGALASSEAECRNFCATYDAMRWAGSTSGDKCTCFSPIASFQGERCATPWGDDVDTFEYIASGTLFSKQPFAACTVDFCDTNNGNHYLCFTGNEVDDSAFVSANGAVSSAGTVESQQSSTTTCLQACVSFAAAEYNFLTDLCRCFDTVDCLAVDSGGQRVSGRSLYLKEGQTAACAEALCVLAPAHELCS